VIGEDVLAFYHQYSELCSVVAEHCLFQDVVLIQRDAVRKLKREKARK
jgi:hypothetical protein